MIEVGSDAPAFTLDNQHGERVALADAAGQWAVVYFYPRASTPGCTVQAEGLQAIKGDLKKMGVRVFGLSPDPVKKIAKFADKYGLEFDLLSDEDHAIADAYGVWGLKKFMGRESMGILRTTFIVNPQGQVASVYEKVRTKEHAERVLADLRELAA